MPFVDEIHIFTDGASRGNPGPSAIAFVIYDSAETVTLCKHNETIGRATNNIAEYRAVIKALEAAKKYTRWKVYVYSDSTLVVNQMKGLWKIKKKHIKDLFDEVKRREAPFKSVTYNHLKRTHKIMQEVDALANQALDVL